jgi:Heavy metal binding domain
LNAVVYAMFVAGWLGVQAEVFACPMHPEVQSSMPGTCLRCGMALLRRSVDPAAPEYVMEIQPRWSSPGSSARLHFRFRTGTGLAAEEFQTVHERELHAFIVSRDLRFFEHAHPTRSNRGEFSLLVTFPALGEYMVFADFVPNGALPQMLQQLVVTPGFRGRMERHGFTAGLDDQIADGLRFALKIEEFKAGTPSLLTFIVTDAATGAPVKDLEPYLGATGHLFFANADFVDAAHSHPLETGPGPTIRFLTRFNAAGLYRAWLQVQRLGRVVTVAWTLDVPEPQR